MRNQTWTQRDPVTGLQTLIADLEPFLDAQGKARIRDHLTGQERVADAQEEAELRQSVITAKKEAAKISATQAIRDSRTGAPWGRLLYDLAVAQGWIEPD